MTASDNNKVRRSQGVAKDSLQSPFDHAPSPLHFDPGRRKRPFFSISSSHLLLKVILRSPNASIALTSAPTRLNGHLPHTPRPPYVRDQITHYISLHPGKPSDCAASGAHRSLWETREPGNRGQQVLHQVSVICVHHIEIAPPKPITLNMDLYVDLYPKTST